MTVGNRNTSAAFILGFVTIVTSIIDNTTMSTATETLRNCSWSSDTLEVVPRQGFWVRLLLFMRHSSLSARCTD